MKIYEIVSEAKLEPDYDFLAQVEEIVDDALEEYGSAIADYDKALSLYPSYPEVWQAKGDALRVILPAQVQHGRHGHSAGHVFSTPPLY